VFTHYRLLAKHRYHANALNAAGPLTKSRIVIFRYWTLIFGLVPMVLQTGSVVKEYSPVTVRALSWTVALPEMPFCAAGITGWALGHPGSVQLVMVTAWVRLLVKVSELSPALHVPPVHAFKDISLLLENFLTLF
jgi:hypothetical protein